MNFFGKLKRIFLNRKGVALLIVLSGISILTLAVVEFSYTSMINYRMAVYSRDRLQAYYLAKSALNFSKIILRYNKEAQKMATDNADKLAGISVEPLYRMVPLSSALIRDAVGGNLSALTQASSQITNDAPDTAETTDDGSDFKLKESEVKSQVDMLNKDEAEKFLDFEGDFSAEISEEQTKFDLNKFYGIETQGPAYDARKKLLLSLLKLPRFEKLFDSDKMRENLVHAIADWIDLNDVINEFDQIQRGSESSGYDSDIKVKNGKMLTLGELRLIPGMTDAIFNNLKGLVTVYSGNEKINVCYADEDMIKALIYHFTHFSGCLVSGVEFDDEKMKVLATEAIDLCPDTQAMVMAVETRLGLISASDEDTPAGKNPENSISSDGNDSGCQFRFGDLVTSDNKVFSVKAIGQVGEVSVILHTVLAESSKGNQFNVSYFRIE